MIKAFRRLETGAISWSLSTVERADPAALNAALNMVLAPLWVPFWTDTALQEGAVQWAATVMASTAQSRETARQRNRQISQRRQRRTIGPAGATVARLQRCLDVLSLEAVIITNRGIKYFSIA